jgi:hypothetical protein
MSRNIKVSHKDSFHISLSHWGLFHAQKMEENTYRFCGTDAFGNKLSEEAVMPAYEYRPIKYSEF